MMIMTSPSVFCPWETGDKDNTLQMITSIMRVMSRMTFKRIGLSNCHNKGMIMLVVILGLKTLFFAFFHAFLALFGPLYDLFGPFLTLFNAKNIIFSPFRKKFPGKA